MGKVDQETIERSRERVFLTLRRYPNGLSEADLEQVTGIQRRTLNNYLRVLDTEAKVWKEGISWFALPFDELRLRQFELSPEEAMTLYLATRLLAKQHDKRNEPAETALMKLAAALTTKSIAGQEIHQAAQELAERPRQVEYDRVFRTVMQGYIYRHVLHLTYEPLRGKPFETDFSPYLIEPSAIGFTTYVIGQSSIVNAIRTYKLERIRSAELTRPEYVIPREFRGLDLLKSAWSVIYGEELVTVILRFSPQVRKRVMETRWHFSEEKDDDPEKPGYLRWKAQVADTTDMLPWIRGWGAACEVLEPRELLETLMGEAKAMAELYGWGVKWGESSSGVPSRASARERLLQSLEKKE
jgi:predicted DNA-binding transcriptional regulator YafY